MFQQLNQICVDTQVRELLLKIQRHITVLEQASARVSSRAEVFGAVQQVGGGVLMGVYCRNRILCRDDIWLICDLKYM